jgi:prolyl-tRNA synthetase
MKLQSKYIIPTLRNDPKDAQIASHKYLIKAGLVKQLAAGIYTYLPLGLNVLKQIENVVREEMENIGSVEILMPALQPADIWHETERFDAYGKELIKLTDRHDRQYVLGPTHEEVITLLVKDYVTSVKKLPVSLFQIQNKFRDEMRPRFGLMRGREFLMKDAYTFHLTDESLDESYQAMKEAYKRIFARLGIDIRIVEADSGQIGGSESAEFMIPSEVGEDIIVYSDHGSFAANIETTSLRAGDLDEEGNLLKEAKTIEIGHIFKLGTKYSELLGAKIQVNDKLEPIKAGCYGIGISRLLMAIIEQNNDEKGIVWPQEVRPFDAHVITFDYNNSQQVEKTMQLVEKLEAKGMRVLVDDRDERFGVKMNDADLIGIPNRYIVGRDTVENNTVEYSQRVNLENKTIVDINKI